MTSNAYKVWRKRLASGTITHPQAVQFCHAICTVAGGYEPRGKRTVVDQSEAVELVDLLIETEPVVDAAAAEVGRRWLAANSHRFGLPDLDWSKIVRFRFVDYHLHTEHHYNGRDYAHFGPVYEAEWSDGGAFRYAPAAWQADITDMWWTIPTSAGRNP